MIDSATTLILVGAALQAVPPARAVVATIRRRRPSSRELLRYIGSTPMPRRDRALEQLVTIAETAVFD